ncbi:hypothetical protein [Bacillus sp. FJAT-27231]|uniref:hypothetical protein n=1 Tax=Bacillus sp. FJAT-27231 TaxID=1679168 RepID=UPI003FA4806B
MVDGVVMRLRVNNVAAGKVALGLAYSKNIEEKGFKNQRLLHKRTNSTKKLTVC